MFCSACGSPNADGAAFCSKCGAPLAKATTAPAQAPETVNAPPPIQSSERKNPYVAAVLNLFFGIGYLYLGYNKVLGVPAILFVIVALIVDVVVGVFTAGIASLLFALLLAYDGYVKANGKKGYINTEPAVLYQ